MHDLWEKANKRSVKKEIGRKRWEVDSPYTEETRQHHHQTRPDVEPKAGQGIDGKKVQKQESYGSET